MNLVKGDTVIVIAGRDKGKTGFIQKVIPESNRVVVENVNLRKKHKKPTQQNPDGGIVEIYAPIDASNVMLYDAKANKIVKSIPKRGADEKKYELAKAEFADMKKAVNNADQALYKAKEGGRNQVVQFEKIETDAV